MFKTIDAIYEDGVFKPLKKLRLRDKQQVQIQILSDRDWQRKFDRSLKAIRSKTAMFSTKEIESDIKDAIKEVRKSRRAS
ncbi:MAG: antitoxin family protein [Nitrospirae bacterium]|nr:antitoxin family protein [Nitrospirota bacterium]